MKKRKAAVFFALCVISMTFAVTVQSLLSVFINRLLPGRSGVSSSPPQWLSFDYDACYTAVIAGTAVIAALVAHGRPKT